MNPTDSLPAGGEPRDRHNRPLIVSLSVGLIALLVGGILLLTIDNSASFGWFGYAPLSGTTFSPFSPFTTQQGQIGMAAVLIGIAILFFCAGWAFGSRRRSDRS